MGDNFVIITIDGQDYYIQADRLADISYIDGKLVNTSNSSITLVSSYSTDNTYPRIQFSAMSQGRYYATSGYNYVAVTSPYTLKSKYNVKQLGDLGLSSAILFTLLIILGVRMVWKR